ncbi:MAG: hypothetical protein HY308_00860 [Gammaproteobacteria bacterium]|nr:hypothetical protein [Gammaproteobacteria bacterium]
MPGAGAWIMLACGLLGVFLFWAALRALRHGRVIRHMTRLLLALVLLSMAALFGLLSFGIQGYRALTREEVAAVVETQPLSPQRFQARFRFADGRAQTYTLAGDELYIDARVLKWTPLANVFGLHTAYELDRVAGRYRKLTDEQQLPRTVSSLADSRVIDLFEWRQRYALLAPLVDAEYGSATYLSAEQPQTLEVRVSTSGLLIRRISGGEPSASQ